MRKNAFIFGLATMSLLTVACNTGGYDDGAYEILDAYTAYGENGAYVGGGKEA